MTAMIPDDLKKLVKLSSSWRKILLIVAIPALPIGAVFLLQSRFLATGISFGVCALFGYLALKPKDPGKNKVVRLLAERPSEVTRVAVLIQSGLGAKSAQIHLFTDKKAAHGMLLVDDVRNLEEALSIIQRYASQADLEREETRVKFA
jgi:hypothetical protein